MIQAGDIVFYWHWAGAQRVNQDRYDIVYAKVLRVNKKTYSILSERGRAGRIEKHLVKPVTGKELEEISAMFAKLKKS